MITISEFMTRDIVTIDSKESLFEAAKLMKEHDIGFLPVLEEGKLAGVVTDRDLVVKGLSQKLSFKAAVKEVMTTKCITIKSDMPVDEAIKVMADHKIRRLCVVENGQLAGVCAIGDIAVTEKFDDDAGEALSEITSPTRRQILEK
ncbi:MAG: CBS domain-containing protein [Bacillota bacterium]